MFSGIVRTVGEIKVHENGRLVVACGADFIAEKGSSVCVSGICLTATERTDGQLIFDVMPVTFEKTMLGGKTVGDAVNVEPSLKVGDELGGHFVYGHVDGVGVVTNVQQEKDATLVTIRLPQDIMMFFAPQASVAVDGVSLTIASLEHDTITVSLVPYTLKNTTLGGLKIGDKVNIECDMLAKIMKHKA